MSPSRRPGTFVWFDLATSEGDAATRFYGALFGWTAQSMPLGGETFTVLRAPGSGAPVAALAPPDGPSRWVSYLSVADVDDALRRALAHGGSATGPAETTPGIGRMAPIADPSGARLCLFAGEGDDPPDGEIEPGAFDENELRTRDAARAIDFYTAVVGATPRARVVPAPPGEAPQWLPYVRVADVDRAATRALELGGQVIEAPHDVATEGRRAILRDPTGAPIGIRAAR